MENFHYRRNVRKYFLGARILPRFLIILGVIFLIAGVVNMATCAAANHAPRYSFGYSDSSGGNPAGAIICTLIGLAGVAAGIYLSVRREPFEAEVDQTVQEEINNLKERGMQKLNVISEQVSLVQPIVVFGAGESPDNSLGKRAAKKRSSHLLLKLLFLPITLLVAIFSLFSRKEDDIQPIERYKIGSDTNLRYMLLQVTLFYFTEDQLLLYTGHVDISTGMIYSESTAEIFYSDISNIATNEILTRYFFKNRFIYKKREYITVSGSGMEYMASFTSDVGKGQSRIDNEFSGMRSLIRDKKSSMYNTTQQM